LPSAIAAALIVAVRGPALAAALAAALSALATATVAAALSALAAATALALAAATLVGSTATIAGLGILVGHDRSPDVATGTVPALAPIRSKRDASRA